MLTAFLHFSLLIASAMPLVDVESVVHENDHSVVVITGTRASNGNQVQGSGVCVSANGYFLATAHQVNGVEKLQARFITGDIVPVYSVEILPELELSLLKTDAPVPGVARLGDANALRSGSPLIAIAAPQNLEFSTITGIVSSTNRTYMDMPVIQTNLQVDSGASGGPVFDQHGQLVGLIMLNLTDADWISAINPINNAYPVLEKYGLFKLFVEPEYEGDFELIPVPNLSEREIRAIEAYNKGVNTETLQEKQEAYQLAITLLPAFFEGWFNLAIAQTQAQELDNALQTYEKALEFREDSLAVYRNMGRIYLKQKAFGKALDAFTKALKLAPGEAQSYNDLGEVYRRMQSTDKAIDAFETALSIRPNYPSACYNLAITQAGTGNNTAAVETFEQYLKLAPDAQDTDTVREWINQLRSTG